MKHTRALTHLALSFSKYTYFRSPSYDNDDNNNLINGYHSINKQIMVLDIGNDEIKVIPNPRNKSMAFWTRMEKKARRK